MNVGTTERKLQSIFDMAKSWGAILLLDEADVFLAKRTSDDMVRNGFVSVFLRLLEYYEGIFFLTTNRIEEFDPAFQLRVHMCIAYGNLDSTKRANIRRNVLQRIEGCRNWDDAVFEKLGQDININGREINNLVRTVLAISTHKGSPLTVDALMPMYELNFSQPTEMGTEAFGTSTGKK
jgi:SpoVK/Ycf46/Vps4 family AAA+-type ATPase